MDIIANLALKSQTVCGAIQLVLFLGSWPTIIGLLKDLHATDRLNFNCIPKPSDVTRQLCYGDYISTVSPLLIPLNFALIICGILGLFWVVFVLYNVLAQRRIYKERDSDKKKCLSERLWCWFLLHGCIQLAVLVVMMGLFCGCQTLHLPEVYMCSRGNTTQIPTNKVNMTCNDLHHRQKSRLNIGLISIMAISILLCVVSIIHLLLTRNVFPQQLLGDQESDNREQIPLGTSTGEDSSQSAHPAAERSRTADTSTDEDSSQRDHPDAEQSRTAAQTTEQDVKDMNREQELDQYEDHDTWLKMVKQNFHSFRRLVKKKQTDQQRKRLNLFVARFQDQIPGPYVCSGCRVILSETRYRCLNCIDVDFCSDCYTKRVKAEGHTENHEVIEMRFKCGDCKGFILGRRFCCYKCPDFLLCFKCQSRKCK